jgi:hypothetical protein
MLKKINAKNGFVIFICLAFLLTACAAPTPSATPSPTITQTNTPQPTATAAPTNTPQPTPLPDLFNGKDPIVAYEAVGVERDRDGKATDNCQILKGKSVCKRFIFIGDPATNNPWGQFGTDGRPMGDWKKIEVFRPVDFNFPQALQLFNNGKSLIYVKELTETGATISIYNLETDENKDYPFSFGVGKTYPFKFVTSIEAIKVTPDGNKALIGVSDMENTAYLFDINYGTSKKIIKYANQVSVDPESKLFFIGSDAYTTGSGVKTSLPASLRPDFNKIKQVVGDIDTSYGIYSYPEPWLKATLSELHLPHSSRNSDLQELIFAITPHDGEAKMVYSVDYSGNAPYSPLVVPSPDGQSFLLYREGKLTNVLMSILPYIPSGIPSMTEGAWFPDGSNYVYVKKVKSNRIALAVYSSQNNLGSTNLVFDPDPLINSTPSPNWGAVGFSIIWPQ